MKRIFLFLLNFSFLCFLGILGFVYFTKTTGASELFSHFAFQYAWISLLYLICYGFLRKKIAITLSLLVFLGTAYVHVSPFTPLEASPSMPEGDEVSILQLNIWCNIKGVDQVLHYVEKNDFPDIIVLQEVTPEILENLEPLRAHYPHRVEAPEAGAYGMAIFSKFPPLHVERVPFEVGGNFYTVLEFQTPQRQIPFTLIELHTTSPARDFEMTVRRRELEEVAFAIRGLPNDRKILLGDLNTTPYSPYFTRLLENTNLQTSTQGIVGTWPTFLPSFCRIPLDHLLMSSKIYGVRQEIGPSVGSDHLPILTRLLVEK